MQSKAVCWSWLLAALLLTTALGTPTGADGIGSNGVPPGAVIETFRDQNGNLVDCITTPPSPPPPRHVARANDLGPGPVPSGLMYIGVPAFDWTYGCSPTAAGMLFGYYDSHGYPNIYTGPANGGVCPSTNAVWGHTLWPPMTFSCGECPFIASHMGKDGRNTRGHVDDYWVYLGSQGADDPYYGHWAQHSPADCIADCMGTSQEFNWLMWDGVTKWYFNDNGTPTYDYTGWEPTYRDGGHGMRLFADLRGYTGATVFNQYIDTRRTGGFTFAQYVAEIDAGRPVLIQTLNHTMCGYGYDLTGSKVYVRNTWDYSYGIVTWGGTYETDYPMWGVTVLRFPSSPTISISAPSPTSTNSGPVTYTVTYAGATSVTLAAGNVTLNRTGSANASVTIGGTDNTTRTVTLSSITGVGTIGISIAAGTAGNASGSAPAAGPSATCAVHDLFHLTVSSNPAVGGTCAASGDYMDGATVNLTPTPNAGYCFVNWSSDSSGTTVLSRETAYGYTMPSADTTIYANFCKAVFFDGFEGMESATGRPVAPTAGIVDMNWATGNAATNGDKTSGNPWWGDDTPTQCVGHLSGIGAHSGSNALWDGQGTGGQYLQQMTYLNLAYRFNNGVAYRGSIYLDWYFYDRYGTQHTLTGTPRAFCDDPASLLYISDASYMPTNADWNTTGDVGGSSDVNHIQKISLGCTDASDGTATYYQARIKVGSKIAGAAATYTPLPTGGTVIPFVGNPWASAEGWYNTTVGRTVGWHHCRIVVGPNNSGSNTIALFIDNMSTAQLVGTATGALYNAVQLKSRSEYSTQNIYGNGVMYDDITFGTLPAPPTASAASDLTSSGITWNWTGSGADGFHAWTADVGGSSASRSVTSFAESGLTANTQYSRWVSAYRNQKPGDIDTIRTALPPTHTLANSPAYATSGDVTIQCDKGRSKGCLPAGSDVTFTFNNAFGDGPANVGQFGCLWDANPGDPESWSGETFWTTGATLVKQTGSSGTARYLHIRSYNNGDPKLVGGVLNLGPYVAGAPVERISDLWPKANDSSYYSLQGKAVTASLPGVFWLEELDRSAAIKVVSTTTVPSGHLANVTGVLGPSGTQRALFADVVDDMGSGPIPGPVLMSMRRLGGSEANYQTPGVSSGVGLYNVGLLVRVAGRVTYSDAGNPTGKFFYLDDGSGLADGSGHAGVKVLCREFDPPLTAYAIVTGVVVSEMAGVDSFARIIIRDGNDIL